MITKDKSATRINSFVSSKTELHQLERELKILESLVPTMVQTPTLISLPQVFTLTLQELATLKLDLTTSPALMSAQAAAILPQQPEESEPMEEPEITQLPAHHTDHQPMELEILLLLAELLELPQAQALSFQDQESLVETLELPMDHHTAMEQEQLQEQVPITELPTELEQLDQELPTEQVDQFQDQFQDQDQVLLMELVQDQVLPTELVPLVLLELLEPLELMEVDYQVYQAAMELPMVLAVETSEAQEAQAELDTEQQVLLALLEELAELPAQLEQPEQVE